MLATTPFSFINIYLALKTSRNNAIFDLFESKTIEKRVIKESIYKSYFWKKNLLFLLKKKRFFAFFHKK